MKKVITACFVSCLFALLIGCSNQQVKQSASSSSKPATTDQTQSSQGSSNSTNQSSQTEPSNQQQSSVQAQSKYNTTVINDIVARAKTGAVKESEFPVDTTTIDQVIAKWGNPDKQDVVDGNRYATYTSRGIVFGINKGDQIFDVRSSSKEVQQITFDNVKQVLGQPNDIRTDSGDTIWIYNVNDKYQLKFAGSKATVDHISVFFQAASKNHMAG